MNPESRPFTIDTLIEVYYYPSDSYEWYDRLTDTYYNKSGQELRHPSEYNTNTDGYTPFGDE